MRLPACRQTPSRLAKGFCRVPTNPPKEQPPNYGSPSRLLTAAGNCPPPQISDPERRALPRCEDAQELIQDATAFAAKLLHNVEQSGKKVTAGNITYYTIQHIKSGTRSTGSCAAWLIRSQRESLRRATLRRLPQTPAVESGTLRHRAHLARWPCIYPCPVPHMSWLDSMKTPQVSSQWVDKLLKRHKSQRSAPSSREKRRADWKKDLQTCCDGRESRKRPTPLLGKKPNAKCQITLPGTARWPME